MRLKPLFLFICIGFILFSSACSDKKKESEEAAPKAVVEDLFNYVPANSPYVIGNVTPLPEPYLKKMIAIWQKLAPSQVKQIKAMADRAPKVFDNQLGKTYIHFSQALLTEIETIKTPEDFQSQWGISPNTKGIVYGLGLLPAFRLRILDKQKVDQLLTRLEEKSGQKVLTANFKGQPYRYIEIKDKIHLKVILSVSDKYLIAGVVPGEQAAFDYFLPLLLGTNKPETPFSQTDFTEKLKKYHFPGYGDGYIDIQKIASIVRGESEGLNAASFKALIPNPDFTWQIGCNPEFNRSLFENMPRMVFGLKTMTDEIVDLEMILELSAHLIDTIKKLPQPIPDIASQKDPMFALGIGAHVPRLRMAIQNLLQFVIDANQNCPEMNTGQLKEMVSKLNMVMNPMISGLHSLIISIDHLELNENGRPRMDTIAACIAADMIDPQGVLSMAGSFIPSLAKTKIDMDGTPTAISLEGLPVTLPDLFVAVMDQRLGLAMGEAASPRAAEAVKNDALAGMPLYWMKYQASTWAQLFQSGISASKKPLNADQKMAMEMVEQYKDLFKSITMGLYTTDNGLSFREMVVME